MSKLTLLLAWVAPLWYLRRASRLPRHVRADLSPFTLTWAVAFGRHQFSTSPSLRTALVAALRKLKQDRPAKTQPPKP